MKIIALYGPQQAGKSEAAKAIALLPRWSRLSFAQPLYDMMSALLGEDARKLDKAAPLDALCGKPLRHALQTLGTEWGRGMVGDTIWLNAMGAAIDRCRACGDEGVVIDDLRFTNEYRLLYGRGATIIRIEREGCLIPTLNQGHASEADWCDFMPDDAVLNNGNLAALRDCMQRLAASAPHAEREALISVGSYTPKDPKLQQALSRCHDTLVELNLLITKSNA